ncbi:PD-(D/E)XK nuclease family protein [Parafilimonas sp.]|uniref:PD-(D/E)XK nuclease family protein n=1 Tax=Parafilimonas sp. TaxID=1969739 RepID=UPI0039E49D85
MKPFLKIVAEDLVKKFGLRIQHCAIVFNNKRPAVYLQKYLADTIQKPFFSPSIFTIQEFFNEAVEEKPADFYMQFFSLLGIYNQLLAEEGLPPLKSSQFFGLAKVVLNDFNQIDNDLVDADKLYKELEDISTINLEFDYLTPEQYAFLSQFWQSYSEGRHKKQQELFIQMWRRMPALYHRFHAALAEKKYITHGGAYRKLAGMGTDEMHFLKKFEKGSIIFIGFNALTRAEAQLFIKLQDAGKALFYFDADSYYLNDGQQEAGYFLRRNINQLHLKNELAAPVDLMRAAPHTADVYKVQGQAAQAKILNHILDADYAQQTEADAVAVVLADEALLIPALQTIPSGIQGKPVTLNVTMGFPLGISTVFGLADLWLSCQLEMFNNRHTIKPSSTHISFQHLESFLTHPLTGVSEKMKSKIRKALIEENIVQVEQSRLIRQGGMLNKFFTQAEQPKQLITALSGVLNDVLNNLSRQRQLKNIDAELFVTTIHELNRLNDNIKDYLENEELPFVTALVQKALQSIRVPLSGDPLQGIQLMGLLETRSLNFNKLVFLGFNEGIIPKTSIGSSFIPDSLRRVYGLPVLENLDAVSAYMVYRLLQRAEHISIVYNCLTDETNNGEPSRFLKQLEYESGFSFKYFELDLPVQTQEKQTIEIDKKNPVVKERLQRYLTKEKTLSPSAITTYIANPIDFFFRYVANIKEPKEVTPVVEANEIGSMLHAAMEDFYRPMLGKEVTKEWIQDRLKQKEALIKRAFAKVRNTPHADTYEFSGMQQVVLAIVEAYINIIAGRDEEEAPFTIIALEEKINAEIPFQLKGQQQSIKIFGIVDRIDIKNGATRIVDYKTGKDELAFHAIDKLFDTNDKYINKALIQTMIYADAYEKKSGSRYVQPVLYVVRSMKENGIVFSSNRKDLEGPYLAELKPAFLAGLESKLAELFNEDIPFKASEVADNYRYSVYTTLF